MSKDKNKKPFSFQLRGMEILEFNLCAPSKAVQEIKAFSFNISSEMKIVLEKKLVFVIISTDILQDDKITKLGALKTNCIFEIENMSDFTDEATNLVNFSDEILTTLNSIAISTTRGIMYCQFKGTYLQSAILPIIDPSSLKKQELPQ